MFNERYKKAVAIVSILLIIFISYNIFFTNALKVDIFFDFMGYFYF